MKRGKENSRKITIKKGKRAFKVLFWGYKLKKIDSTPPPPFLFLKTMKKVIRLCAVLIFF